MIALSAFDMAGVAMDGRLVVFGNAILSNFTLALDARAKLDELEVLG